MAQVMRSMFLKGESYEDVMLSLAKADTLEERNHLISERLKQNGWTKEKELRYREHCDTCGYVLPFQRAKKNPLAENTVGRTNARLLSEAAKAELRQSAINREVE